MYGLGPVPLAVLGERHAPRTQHGLAFAALATFEADRHHDVGVDTDDSTEFYFWPASSAFSNYVVTPGVMR